MTVEILAEPDIPEGILRLLASPVSRSRQTWYLGAHSAEASPRWLIATLWPEPPRAQSALPTCWGLRLRGEADATLVGPLVDALAARAAALDCPALLTDAIALEAPFDLALRARGFTPQRSYRTVHTSTLAALRGLGLGVRGAALETGGWHVGPPRDGELPLLAAIFLKELGHIPPQLTHLGDAPAEARAWDESSVLRRDGHPVGALIARRIDRHIDIQGLVCHPRWRAHRALSWLLAECTARWPLHADTMTFSYPEDNHGIVDIARRIDARPLVRRHDLLLRTAP